MEVALITYVLLFPAFLFCIEIGYRIAMRSMGRDAEVTEPEKVAATFVLTLLSLVLAFSLSAARDMYKERAQKILAEAQAIRAARVAIDDLDGELRKKGLALAISYVESKRAYNTALNNSTDPKPHFDKSGRILHEIRALCRSSSEEAEDPKVSKVLERLETVSEIGLERDVLVHAPQDKVAFSFLIIVAAIACFLVGHAHRTATKRSWWAGMLFAGVVSATMVLILDYSSPRGGLIRVDSADVLYEELRR